MKTREKAIKDFIVNNKYGENREVLSEYAYSQLSEEEKSKYTEINSDNEVKYSKPDNIPEISDSDISFLAALENNELLHKIQKDVRIIQRCALLFTVLISISILITIIQAINLGMQLAQY